MRLRSRVTAVLLATFLVLPVSPALAEDPYWQIPLWFKWFSPEPAQVDPLADSPNGRQGIDGPGMTAVQVDGSLESVAPQSRVRFTSSGGQSAFANMPAFRKPEQAPRPNIARPNVRLSWGAERHPRPPRAQAAGGNGVARKFVPSERPITTLPSKREVWNYQREDGIDTYELRQDGKSLIWNQDR